MELEEAPADLKTLRGLAPICARCGKMRDDEGYRNQVEDYVSSLPEADFSNDLCLDCEGKLQASPHKGAR